MKPFTKGLLVGALGTLLITGAGVAIGGKYVLDGLQMARKAIATEAAEAVETQTYPLASLRRISVSTGVGDVTIEAGDVPDVRVTARRVARAATLSLAQDALTDVRSSAQVTRRGTLLLRQEQAPRREAGTEGQIGREVHFTIVVPRQAKLIVSARAGVGKVTLTGLGAGASGEAGVGDVTARDVAGPLTLESGTGDVYARGGKGDLTAEAGIGQVRIHGREGRVSVKTGTGDIEADLAKLTAPADLETGIGGVTLTVTRKLDARFELSAGLGHITNGLADVKPEQGANDDKTVVVLGKGTHAVKASTGTGDIRLKPGD